MEASNNMAVHCEGVTKSYGTGSAKVTALQGIDLEVYAGELLMLVSPSGCGKTTLISVIAAILDQDEGECLVFGQNLKRLGQRDKTHYRGRHIGFVFQAFNLLPICRPHSQDGRRPHHHDRGFAARGAIDVLTAEAFGKGYERFGGSVDGSYVPRGDLIREGVE